MERNTISTMEHVIREIRGAYLTGGTDATDAEPVNYYADEDAFFPFGALLPFPAVSCTIGVHA